jgi:hypothetical protein
MIEIELLWWFIFIVLGIYLFMIVTPAAIAAAVVSWIVKRRWKNVLVAHWSTRQFTLLTVGIVTCFGLFPPFVRLFLDGAVLPALSLIYIFSALPLLIIVVWPGPTGRDT